MFSVILHEIPAGKWYPKKGFVESVAYFSPHPNPERCGRSAKPFFVIWTKTPNYANIIHARACNSAGECYLHTVEVCSSNLHTPKQTEQATNRWLVLFNACFFKFEAWRHEADNTLPFQSKQKKINHRLLSSLAFFLFKNSPHLLCS